MLPPDAKSAAWLLRMRRVRIFDIGPGPERDDVLVADLALPAI